MSSRGSTRLTVGYHPARLRPPGTRLDELEIVGGAIATRKLGNRWDLLEVMRKSSDTTGGGGFAIDRMLVRDVAVAAELAPDSVAHARLQELAVRDLRLGDTALATIDRLQLAVQPPGSGRWLALATRGQLTHDEIRFDPVRLSSEASEVTGHVVLPRTFENPRMVDRARRAAGRSTAGAGRSRRPRAHPFPRTASSELDAQARGRGDLITAHLAAAIDRGRLTLDGGTRLRQGKPTSYRVHGVVTRLDPSRLSRSAPAGDVSARLDADLTGARHGPMEACGLDLGGSRIGTAVAASTRARRPVVRRDGRSHPQRRHRLRHRARGRARAAVRFPADLSPVGLRHSACPDRCPRARAHRCDGQSIARGRVSARGRGELPRLGDGRGTRGSRRGAGHRCSACARTRDAAAGEGATGGSTRDPGRRRLGDGGGTRESGRHPGVRAARRPHRSRGSRGPDRRHEQRPAVGTLHTERPRHRARRRRSSRRDSTSTSCGTAPRRVERVDAMATLTDGRLRLTGEGAVQGGRARARSPRAPVRQYGRVRAPARRARGRGSGHVPRTTGSRRAGDALRHRRGSCPRVEPAGTGPDRPRPLPPRPGRHRWRNGRPPPREAASRLPCQRREQRRQVLRRRGRDADGGRAGVPGSRGAPHQRRPGHAARPPRPPHRSQHHLHRRAVSLRRGQPACHPGPEAAAVASESGRADRRLARRAGGRAQRPGQAPREWS